jgi:hypothetical protein
VLLAYWFIVLKSLGVLPIRKQESLFFARASTSHTAIDTKPPAPLATARMATTGSVYLLTRINRVPMVFRPVGTLLESISRILPLLQALQTLFFSK